MYGGAQSQYTISDCQPVSVPPTSSSGNQPGMACFSQIQNYSNNSGGTGIYVWSVSLQSTGGCVDTSGNPVMVNNWANINPVSCTNTVSAFNSNMNTSSCTYNGAPVSGQTPISFTCSNTFGTFKDISTATTSTSDNGPDFSHAYAVPNGDMPGQPATLLAQGANCANVATEASLITAATTGGTASTQALAAKKLLASYQCYANAYWQHSSNGAGSTTSCARNYDFNWSANSYSNFVIGDDRSMKPQNAFITDRLIYSQDGQWGFLKNTTTQYQSIPTSTGSTLCPLATTIQMKVQRLSDAQVLVDFTQNGIVTDTSANCQGAVAAAMAGGGNLSPDPTGLNNLYQNLVTNKMLFVLNKTGN
jgi:hypothetical protein